MPDPTPFPILLQLLAGGAPLTRPSLDPATAALVAALRGDPPGMASPPPPDPNANPFAALGVRPPPASVDPNAALIAALMQSANPAPAQAEVGEDDPQPPALGASDDQPSSLSNSSLTSPSDPYQSDPISSGRYQLAAASAPGFRDQLGLPWCAACHGYRPGPLPPDGGQAPLPPTYSRRSGGSGGSGGQPPSSGGRPSAGKSPRQCWIQYDNDHARCGRAPGYIRGVCRGSAGERLGHCIGSNGEVDWPPLITR
jgi:hypothetical protein